MTSLGPDIHANLRQSDDRTRDGGSKNLLYAEMIF
jgi:hypothetical protein